MDYILKSKGSSLVKNTKHWKNNMQGKGSFDHINWYEAKGLVAVIRLKEGVNISKLINSQFLKRFELDDADLFKEYRWIHNLDMVVTSVDWKFYNFDEWELEGYDAEIAIREDGLDPTDLGFYESGESWTIIGECDFQQISETEFERLTVRGCRGRAL